MTEEKTGILKRVAPSTGGILFEDEPDQWYNATATAKNYIKADLKGKRVTIRIADKPNKFSFISLAKDQPEEVPGNDNGKQATAAPISKDDYWERKEARDRIVDEKITRAGALNTALEAIKASITSGSSGATMKAESILDLAETLAKTRIIPFIKNEQKKTL